ncbi:NAD(P)H-hydrate dehydratase [uncultured Oxalicibacterium sp.]|uniref:NAD(P)H-hydrate dehydratase n=1 Tax=uncultured Oxalicibacterium sp. TaxID=1168540 RepID=UPI0025EB43FB|nr:NAD(P)H-hydrate dehydratase [uncultured Oxalicibacterium sp.]
MMPIQTLYPVGAIRRIEEAALRSLPPFSLMQRAGAAGAQLALEIVSERMQGAQRPPNILILAGPGNNGGDALEAAHLLASSCEVSVMLLGAADTLPADAQIALQRANASHLHWLEADALHITDQKWDLIIDGVFGIGLARPITGTIAALINHVNASNVPVLSLDVPSGLDADTGNVVGKENGCAVHATVTLTFIGDKPGLHTGDGRDHAGEVRVASLDIDPAYLHATRMQVGSIAHFSEQLKPRRHNSHKGTYGDVVILGGAPGMLGAAVLAARTAAKLGAGRVYMATLDPQFALDVQQPEIMCRSAEELTLDQHALIVGPGLGTTRAAQTIVAKALQANSPLVLDADALNLLALEPGLQKKLGVRHQPTIFTPHPLEAARLLDCDTAAIQADRISAARTLASRLHATVILKGSGSITAEPGEGRIVINPTGNPALATAGAGDVLSGVCGALLAQNWPAWQAAVAAAWLHGHAADQLVARGIGPIGLTASELIPEIRLALNQLIATQGRDYSINRSDQSSG